MNYFFFIYHGYGWAVLLLLGGSWLAIEALFKALNVVSSTTSNLTGALAYILAAPLCWFLGKYLLGYRATMVNEATGEKVKVPQPYHALFWIRIHWWAPIFFVIGVWIIILDPQKAPGIGSPRTSVSVAAPPKSEPQNIQGGTLKYSLTIPGTWEFARNQESFDIFTTAPDSIGNYWLGVYALSEAQGDTERWAGLLMEGKFAGVFTRSKPTIIADHQWAVLDGSTQDSGVTLTCRIYAYSEQGSAYAIMLMATPSAWQSHAPELMSIARSFTFPIK